MRDLFIISDTHFGHANMLRFTDSKTDLRVRPNWESVDEMDEHMIDRWNSVVQRDDIVYHLGDVYMGGNRGLTVLPRLRGRKRLILGNHDNGKDQNLHRHFEKILMWRMFPEFRCLLTHVPVHESTLNAKVPYNLHGHIHQNSSPSPQHINCCVEVQHYTPRSIEELVPR